MMWLLLLADFIGTLTGDTFVNAEYSTNKGTATSLMCHFSHVHMHGLFQHRVVIVFLAMVN